MANFILDTWSGSDKEDLIEILKQDNIKFKDLGGGKIKILIDRDSFQASTLISYLIQKDIKFDESEEKMEEYKFESENSRGLFETKKNKLKETIVKVGDTVEGTVNGSLLFNKKGKVIKITDDTANVDFGNGDIYGILLNRIEDGKIVK
jgi:hypothetical protein